MIPLRKRRTKNGVVTGVAIDGDGFALVSLRRAGDLSPRLEVCEYHPCEGEEELARNLRAAVKDNRLRGSPAFCVLDSDSYTIRPVDAPQVPEEEMREATRWAVRELIDFDLDEAAVEVLPIPEGEVGGQTNRLYAVVARVARVDSLVELVRASGLDPQSVDVGELATRNLVSGLGDPSDGVAFLNLSPKASRLEVVRDGMICVARDIAADLSLLYQAEIASEAELQPVFDSLLLEVQRSLDYYESQFGRIPASRLWVAPSEHEISMLATYLGENLTVPVEMLDLNEALSAPSTLPQVLQERALLAVGASLRQEDQPQIHLWSIESAAPVPPLSAVAILRASGLFAVCLVVLAGLASWSNARNGATVSDLEAQLARENERLAALEAGLSREPDPTLLNQIAQLQLDRAEKVRVLEALGNTGTGNTRGFSPLFTGLARQDLPSVWLKRIEVREGGHHLALEGGAMTPQEVPRFLEGLSRERAFAGKEFKAFKLSLPADESPGLVFSLDTQAEDPS